MKIDFDQLIQIVAERHKFILSKDDPVLASVSLNEVIFEMHGNALIERMDEQNSRTVAAVQGLLNSSKSDAKSEREKFIKIVNAVHQKHIAEHKKLLDDQLNSTANYAKKIEKVKNSSGLILLATLGIAIFSICANLFISISK